LDKGPEGFQDGVIRMTDDRLGELWKYGTRKSKAEKNLPAVKQGGFLRTGWTTA
jgi:hypothetical protein